MGKSGYNDFALSLPNLLAPSNYGKGGDKGKVDQGSGTGALSWPVPVGCYHLLSGSHTYKH